MKVFNILKNLWSFGKAYSDANLQAANNYTNSKTEFKEITLTNIDTTKADLAKCYQFGKMIFVIVHIKSGTGDQSQIAQGLPKPLNEVATLSHFCMNQTDLARDICGFVQNNRIEVRCTSAVAGGSGVYLSTCYIAE